MKKTILIITNNKIRQLYHEMLQSENIEVTPIADLSLAIMLLNLNTFDLAVLDNDQNLIETEIFLRLRQKHRHLSRTKFIILSKNKDFHPKIIKTDLLIDSSKTPIKSIIDQIRKLL